MLVSISLVVSREVLIGWWIIGVKIFMVFLWVVGGVIELCMIV